MVSTSSQTLRNATPPHISLGNTCMKAVESVPFERESEVFIHGEVVEHPIGVAARRAELLAGCVAAMATPGDPYSGFFPRQRRQSFRT